VLASLSTSHHNRGCGPTAGGMISDFFAKRYGMRGRLWWLWSCQTIAGVLCIGLGLAENSFVNTMIVLCFFSFFVQVRIPCSCAHGTGHVRSGPLRGHLHPLLRDGRASAASVVHAHLSVMDANDGPLQPLPSVSGTAVQAGFGSLATPPMHGPLCP